MVKKPKRIVKEVGNISTYEEFSIIIGFAMLVVAIINVQRKK